MSGKSIRKMLSLRDLNSSQASIARELRVDPSTVSRWFKKANELSLDYSQADQMSDEELEDAFNGTMGRKRIQCHAVDLDSFVKKAGKRRNVDKIYRSYCEAVKKSGSPIEAVSRATFFRRVGEYRSQRKTYSMKTVWNAKEYMQIDLCGDVIILKPDSEGHSATIHVFVAKLPHSGMIYAKALTGCKGVDWNEGIVGAFEYFQGITDIILCDNDKALVADATVGDQELTESFEQLAGIYGFEVEYARPACPTDKAAVEAAVGLITDEVITGVKNCKLKVKDDVQRLLDKCCSDYNQLRNEITKVTPLERFRTQEQPLLKKLPTYAKWTRVGARMRRIIDESRCVKVDGHYYLMPHTYPIRTIDVVETRDGQLLFFKPGCDKVVATYTHFEKKKPGPDGNFTHIKAEYRAPNEVTAEVQLSREMERFATFGDETKRYAARYVSSRSNKTKRVVAQQLGFLWRHMKDMDKSVVEQASSFALKMHNFDKKTYLIYLEGAKKLSEMPQEGRKKDKPTPRGACLHTKDAKVPQFPRLQI